MQDIEELISRIEEADLDITAATREYKTIESSPHFVDVKVDGRRIIFTTQPISIHNPEDPTQTVNLGRLEIYIYDDGSYRVGRDETSERSNALDRGQIHPHVSSTRICQGNAADMSHLAQERQLAMLATFIYEFLHNYNPSSPYWRPLFSRPCVTCEHAGTDRCFFCQCNNCSNRSGDYCRGCSSRGMTNTGNAVNYLNRQMNEHRQRMDEDQFITLATDLATHLRQKVEEMRNV